MKFEKVDYEKRLRDYLSSDIDQMYKNMLLNLFPELGESEDEKVRKELIEYIKDQQSSFISAPDCRDKNEEEENNKYNSWIAWLEKQGEQKTAWSEEDEDIRDNIIRDLKRLSGDMVSTNQTYQKEIQWLKSIKDRVQPQPQQWWSNEDYNEIETIACHLDNIDNEGMAEMLRNIRDKYYHIIPQSTWKPSDSQMYALKKVILCGTSVVECGELNNLYEDLKKLREE